MKSSVIIERNIIVDTLVNLEEPVGVFPIRNLVPLEGATGQYKIFWEHVPMNVALPYIVISHMIGGRGQGTDANQSYSDTNWKIVFHTADVHKTEDMLEALALLQDRCPDTSRYVGITPVMEMQELAPFYVRYLAQNTPQFIVGGIYRLYLNLGSN